MFLLMLQEEGGQGGSPQGTAGVRRAAIRLD